MKLNATPKVNSQYGAPMGRASHAGRGDGDKWGLVRVRINSGGYDEGGAYWGLGSPLYYAQADNGDGAGVYFRVSSDDRSEAFEAMGGVRIGAEGYEAFRQRCPNWSREGWRYAAKHVIRRDYDAGARFYR